MDIVKINSSYSYSVLEDNLNSFVKFYPFVDVRSIGKSVMGKNIYAVRLGVGNREVFYCGSFHANEWITSVVLMKFIEDYCDSYLSNSSLFGYNIRDLFDNCSIFIVPMVNPDGVDLVNGFLDTDSNYFFNAKKIASDFKSIPFPDGWKSDINGIDLNLQFPARVGKC